MFLDEVCIKYGNTGAHKACSDIKYSHNRQMMNAVTQMNSNAHPLLPEAPIGLPIETIMSLSDEARCLYNQIFDYCTYAADPRYQTLHTYRKRIAALDNIRDRESLIAYFNMDPAIQFTHIPEVPWIYYAKPYDAT